MAALIDHNVRLFSNRVESGFSIFYPIHPYSLPVVYTVYTLYISTTLEDIIDK